MAGSRVITLRTLSGLCRVDTEVAARCGCPTPESAAEVVEALVSGRGELVRSLKTDRRSTVRDVSWGGRRWVVKCYPRNLARAMAGRLIGHSPCATEWHGAALLERLGVSCNRPMARVWDRRLDGRGWVRAEALVLPLVDGSTLARVIAESVERGLSPERQRALAVRVGRQMGRVLRAGWAIHDSKPHNAIVVAGRPEPVLIDPQLRRMTLLRGGRLAAWKMLGNAWGWARWCGPITDRQGLRTLREALREAGWLERMSPSDRRSALRSVMRYADRVQPGDGPDRTRW